jgi:hypothetical protein
MEPNNQASIKNSITSPGYTSGPTRNMMQTSGALQNSSSQRMGHPSMGYGYGMYGMGMGMYGYGMGPLHFIQNINHFVMSIGYFFDLLGVGCHALVEGYYALVEILKKIEKKIRTSEFRRWIQMKSKQSKLLRFIFIFSSMAIAVQVTKLFKLLIVNYLLKHLGISQHQENLQIKDT